MVAFLSFPLSLFPDEAALIGALVIGYGEIEYDLATCVEVAVGDRDPSSGFKAIYCNKGEEARIRLAETLCRSLYSSRGLEHEFMETVAGVRHCKKIRNQYAHSNWSTANAAVGQVQSYSVDGLRLVLLEESASRPGPMIFELRTVTLKLLEEQEEYFRNIRDWLIYLMVAFRAGGAQSGRGLRPKRLSKPERFLLPVQMPPPP